MATFVSGLATSTPRRVASADPRGVWIATNRNRAPVSRSITNRTHQEQSTQTPSNKMSRSGASSIVRGIHRLLIRSSTHIDDSGRNLFVLCRRRLLRPNHGRWRGTISKPLGDKVLQNKIIGRPRVGEERPEAGM